MAQNTNNNHITIKQGLEAANRQFDLLVAGFKQNGIADMNGIPAFEDAKILVQFFEQKLAAQKKADDRRLKQAEKDALPPFDLKVGDSVIGTLARDFEKGFTFVHVLQRCNLGQEPETVTGECKDVFLHITAVPETHKDKLAKDDLITFNVVAGKKPGELAAAGVICEEEVPTHSSIADVLTSATAKDETVH